MRGVEFLLLFFIIYNTISTLLFLYIWNKTRELSEEKTKYIDELLYEIGKLRVDKKEK